MKVHVVSLIGMGIDSFLADEPSKDFSLPASASIISITDLTPDLDYSVSINSYVGTEESIPIFGQLTSKYIQHINIFIIQINKY